MRRLLFKYFVSITILVISFSLSGCGTPKNIIPTLKYRENIEMHVPKNAYIYWVPGKQISSEIPSYSSAQNSSGGLAGLAVNLVFGVVEQQQRKNNPSQYSNEYGKADESVFMTSLRDALDQQDVFKRVDLITDLSKVLSRDVLIQVYFKTARVINISDTKLSVVLTIKSGNLPIYEKTYFVQNKAFGTTKAKIFVDRKTEVSEKLLYEVIGGIKQWYKENKR